MRGLPQRSKGMVKKVKVLRSRWGYTRGRYLAQSCLTVMQAIADNFKKGLPCELLYADDLVLLAESRPELEKRLTEWMARLKEKGLQANIGKTKVMNCKVGVGQAEKSGKYPCGICRKGVGRNSARLCTSCKKWIHRRCGGVVGRLAKVGDFKCRNCSEGGAKEGKEVRQFVLEAGEEL